MNNEAGNGLPNSADWLPEPAPSFAGFAPPTSNTTYTPNQFFDVCLPHSSRGVVRLVAYMIRKTLGWCDANGTPQNETVLAGYDELSQKAGISHARLREALDEAVAGNFIRCLRPGRPNKPGLPAVTALYQLRWDPRPEYIKDPRKFQGFFEGEGHRTDIPNQYFDQVIPRETLAIIKAVGAIIRFSIGFQAGRGSRRQQVQLSYTHIQNYTRMKNRNTLSEAIEDAIASNYIVRVNEGFFDPDAGATSKAAVYALRWADLSPYQPNGLKNVPVKKDKTRPQKRTGNCLKNVPEKHAQKRTDIETKQQNETFKQQPADAAADLFDRLTREGFGQAAARRLVELRCAEEIENQIRWLPDRGPIRNRLGMLRRAIEENWPAPGSTKVAALQLSERPGTHFAQHFYAGHAGNPGAPAAPASHGDSEAAERFVERLLAICPAPEQVPEWGRSFGQFVRERHRGQPILHFVVALRAYGDEFLIQHERRQRAAAAAAEEKAREEHRTRFEPQWLAYLRTIADQIRREQPRQYQRFGMQRANERERVRKSQWGGPAMTERALAHFDSDRQFLLAFLDHFRGQVPDFWEWNKVHRVAEASTQPS